MDFYVSQSRFTDPGALASWLASVGPELADIRVAATQLVFHYRAQGDITDHGFPPERRAEIDLRYADDMLGRLYELNPAPPGKARTATERVVGCCRDSTLLFVAMARHHGIPARARVGFATYLMADWALDHVIAEVWDAAEQRWRLVEPEFEEGQVAVDLLDVPRDRFLVGADAWAACRSGERDAERFVVAPELELPFLRGWPYLMHNLVLDLAALNKREMLLWDLWGVIETADPSQDSVAQEMDALAAELRAPGLTTDRLAAAFDVAGLRVPDVITSVTPNTQQPRQVTLRHSRAGA
jgi:Transglutaminase-like superfamily